MPRHRALLLFLALILAAEPAGAGVLRYATGKDDKPVDPDFIYQKTVFDCTPRQTFTPVVGWTDAVTATTLGAPSLIDGYPCGPGGDMAGPEHIYEVVVTQELEFWAGLAGLVQDLDIILLSDCDTDSCLIVTNTEFTAVLSPGTYILIVDTYGPATSTGGPYTLSMAGRWPGVPTIACDTADTTFHPCADPETLAGDLEGQPDLVRNYDCDGGTLLRGGEAWYALVTPPGHMVSLTAIPGHANLDIALALFSGCGPDAVCLAFADDNLTDPDPLLAAETIQWPQAAAEQDTVWLAVDSFRSPAAGEGSFSLVVDCGTVPAEQTSFGSFRARYR